jgi:tRNA (guanine37-N1)-methyltransferase
MKTQTPKSYDVIGDILIIKFPDKTLKKQKLIIANKILKEKKNINVVLEKSEKVKGRLRTIKTNYLAGEKRKETLYKENDCLFKLDVDKCYFSSRLSNERKEVVELIKKHFKNKNKKINVLVMFAGVAPFSIVIAKKLKKIFPNLMVHSLELNRTASKYAQENIILNKLDNIKIIQGNVSKVKDLSLNKKLDKKYDVVVMPRPQLKDIFLKEAFFLAKKNTLVVYYDFCQEQDIFKIKEKVLQEAKKSRKKVKILNVKKAGEIAPYRNRIRIDFKIV